MILDTNALSAFFDGDKKLIEILNQSDSLDLPVIVVGEYRFGLKASTQRSVREPRLAEFCKVCNVLPILDSTSRFYATIKHDLKKSGNPIPENDIWICALAVEYSLPILTLDRHFNLVKSVESISW